MMRSISAFLGLLILLGTHAIDESDGSEDESDGSDGNIIGEVRDNQDSVDFFGEVAWTREIPRASARDDRPRTATSTDSSESRCLPRVRHFDGAEHPGWVCPGSDGVPGEYGGLVWVPAGASGEGGGASEGEQLVLTREDVQSLLVNSGSVEIQPDRSWVLVNIETIVMTDAAEHVLTTQVLDLDVELRLVPAQFTWDFGDGTAPVIGTDPGAPWPNHTVAHVYDAPGDARVTLRTEWDAHFRVAGTADWFPVLGRPVTVATSDPFEVVTATPRLISPRGG